MTHWKKLTNPDYLGSYSFEDGRDKVLTIAGVKNEVITGAEGKKETCMVLRFKEPEKPLILNRTNAKSIAKVADSPQIEDWEGLRIQLYVRAGVRAFGEIVDAVRIREYPPKLVPTCTTCGQPITGTRTSDSVQIAARTKAKYGVELCVKCATEKEGKA